MSIIQNIGLFNLGLLFCALFSQTEINIRQGHTSPLFSLFTSVTKLQLLTNTFPLFSSPLVCLAGSLYSHKSSH